MTLDEVADRFVRGHLGISLSAFPMGHAGIVRLADAIDAWCEIDDPSDEADRAFVEGAGALLGLLLIDHVGDGAHVTRDGVHRVRLGPRGWFDPFGAIEAVLDADDPRAALAERVREAEAEARDQGRTSRVLYAIERSLEESDPPARVAEHFEHYVRLEPAGELDIARIVSATEGQGQAAVEQAVQKLVGMLRGTERSDVSWDDARGRLLPRLVSGAMLEELGAALFASPIGHGVVLTMLLRYDDRARYVRADEVSAWGGETSVVPAALANLAARSGAARFARLDTVDGPIVVARSGDGLDAARLLLPTLHDVLATELGSPFLAAVPHRDTLLASPCGPRAIAEALRERAADETARAPHGISGGLFEVGPRGIRAVP